MPYSWILLAGVASPFFAFQQSDAVGRMIVLLLGGASILSWSIMVDKWLEVRQAESLIQQTLTACERILKLDELLAQLGELSGPLARIGQATTQAWNRLGDAGELGAPPYPLNPGEVEMIRGAINKRIEQEIGTLEARLSLLATIVSVSPFLGLLGTVWGVMMAFTGMASSGRADIAALAPGVSGALLTTVAGLLVAIPSLVGFNLLTARIQRLNGEMDLFGENLGDRIAADQKN